MARLLHPELVKIFHGLFYRFRFIGIYIIIGILSLLIELAVRSQLTHININVYLATAVSLIVGILFAFYGNTYFNFKVPPARRNRAFVYFIVISVFSGVIQWLVAKKFVQLTINYEQGRLIISGSMFLIAYFLHRRFTFRDFKRVGVAIYANGVEDLSGIHKRIGQYPDFIHVDIVDSSFYSQAQEIKTYRMETIRALWPDREIHTHIMSRKPSRWLQEVLPYSDTIYIHWECDEDIEGIIKTVKKEEKKIGVALCMDTTIDEAQVVFDKVDSVLMLTIQEPGRSGQLFDFDGLERIVKLNSNTFRGQMRVCVDGGINDKVVRLLKVEDVVSGSSVLSHQNPRKQILNLQSGGYYE